MGTKLPSTGRGLAVLLVLALVELGAQPALAAHPAPAETEPVGGSPEPYVDPDARLSIVPPSGWLRSPVTSLNPQSDPPEPVLEVVRFQLRLRDQSLYAQPVALTSGLVQDAGAVISVALARSGTDLVGVHPDPRQSEVGTIPGWRTLDDEATYEGVLVHVRIFFARHTDRVIVTRAMASEADWSALAPAILAAIASLRADPTAPNAPAAAPPPPPPPAPVYVDGTLAYRGAIVSRAASLLGVAYVWGGNSPRSGMDCSAYVSAAWGVDRYTTDSIWRVSSLIGKADLRTGDALNLTTGRDPTRFGHIRLFEAWANDARSLLWVYEETPPRAVHRVIAYDDRYQPIRLDGLSSAGSVAVVPGTPAPQRTDGQHASFRYPSPTPTRKPPTPTALPKERPKVTPTPSPVRR